MNFKSLLLLLIVLTSPFGFAQEDKLEKQFNDTSNELTGMSPEEFNEKNNPKGTELEDNMVTGMMTGVMKQVVQEFLKENPFSKMPREEIKSMITVKMNGLPVEKLIKKHPKLLDLFVDWIRDESALPKLFGIVNKPDKVKTYGIIVIVIFILSFALNLANSKGSLIKRIFKKMGVFAGAFLINVGSFVFLFKDELNPTFKVILRYYHL